MIADHNATIEPETWSDAHGCSLQRLVRLTPAEMAFVYCLAAQRFSCKPEHDRFTASRISPFGSHVVGVMGELVAAKCFGGKIDQTISRSGDKHRHDIIRSGRKIEVKAITFNGHNPMLKLTSDELIAGVEYVLAQVVWPDSMIMYPPIESEMFRRLSREHDFGYGKRLVVTADEIVKANSVRPDLAAVGQGQPHRR